MQDDHVSLALFAFPVCMTKQNNKVYHIKSLSICLAKKESVGLKVVPFGFVVYLDKACFSASPNSFVECSCCGPGVLEVKCPLLMRTESFDAALERSSFYLEFDDDDNLRP